MCAHIGADAQVGFARERGGELLLCGIEARRRVVRRDGVVGGDTSGPQREGDGDGRHGARGFRKGARALGDRTRRGRGLLHAGARKIVGAGIFLDAEDEGRSAGPSELEFCAVLDRLAIVGGGAIDRDERGAEQFDGPRAGGTAHQREVMSCDVGFFRRKMDIAIGMAAEDDALPGRVDFGFGSLQCSVQVVDGQHSQPP